MENYIKNDGFNFNVGEAGLIDLIDEVEPGEKDGKLRTVRIFSEDYGEALIDLFFLNAEVELYNIRKRDGNAVSWKEYLAEMKRSGPMWDKLQNVFHDGLKRLDFRIGWLSDELSEVHFLQKPQE